MMLLKSSHKEMIECLHWAFMPFVRQNENTETYWTLSVELNLQIMMFFFFPFLPCVACLTFTVSSSLVLFFWVKQERLALSNLGQCPNWKKKKLSNVGHQWPKRWRYTKQAFLVFSTFPEMETADMIWLVLSCLRNKVKE